MKGLLLLASLFIASSLAQNRATWISTKKYCTTAEECQTTMARLASLGINTVYLESYYQSKPFFYSQTYVDLVGAQGMGPDFLGYATAAARQNNIKVWAWFSYSISLRPLDPRHPNSTFAEYAIRNRWTSGNNGVDIYLDPTKPEVREYLKGVVRDVFLLYPDCAGVQLDDRFNWPKVIPGSSATALNNLMKEMWMVADDVRKTKNSPSAYISLAPLDKASALQGNQDWPTWFSNGWITDVIPQLYFPAFSSFQNSFPNNFGSYAAGPALNRMGVGIRLVGTEDLTKNPPIPRVTPWPEVSKMINFASSYGAQQGYRMKVISFWKVDGIFEDQFTNFNSLWGPRTPPPPNPNPAPPAPSACYRAVHPVVQQTWGVYDVACDRATWDLYPGDVVYLRRGVQPTTCLNGRVYLPLDPKGWVVKEALVPCQSTKRSGNCATTNMQVSVRDSPCGAEVDVLLSEVQTQLVDQPVDVVNCEGKPTMWSRITQGYVPTEALSSCDADLMTIDVPASSSCKADESPTEVSAYGSSFIAKWEGGPVDLSQAEACVASSVKAPLNANQFDALVSFAVNVGCAAFNVSRVLTTLNSGAFGAVCSDLVQWSRDATGNVLLGLINRRNAECSLFHSCERIIEANNFVYCPAADACSSCILNSENDAIFAFYKKQNYSVACDGDIWRFLAEDWCTNANPWDCYYKTLVPNNGTNANNETFTSMCPACAPRPKPVIPPLSPGESIKCVDNVPAMCVDSRCPILLVGSTCDPATGNCVKAKGGSAGLVQCVAAETSSAFTLAATALAAALSLLV